MILESSPKLKEVRIEGKWLHELEFNCPANVELLDIRGLKRRKAPKRGKLPEYGFGATL